MHSYNYDKFPEIAVPHYDNHAWQGWSSVVQELSTQLSGRKKTVVVIDCYPGVRLGEIANGLFSALNATLTLNVETARHNEQDLHHLLARNLTDDRVFGVLSCHQLSEFFIANKLAELRQQVTSHQGELVIVYGPGAALVCSGDVLIYADMPRWEIQRRMRSGELGNWGVEN